MNKQEELFNRFKSLGLRLTSLGSFVQNEGFNPTSEQLLEFVNLTNENLSDLNKLREDVLRFYQN